MESQFFNLSGPRFALVSSAPEEFSGPFGPGNVEILKNPVVKLCPGYSPIPGLKDAGFRETAGTFSPSRPLCGNASPSRNQPAPGLAMIGLGLREGSTFPGIVPHPFPDGLESHPCLCRSDGWGTSPDFVKRQGRLCLRLCPLRSHSEPSALWKRFTLL